jgi:transcriptional regulator with GAF, ATPase, and Fis domain
MFLDEIGDMSPSTQAKVLRVLQEHEFERLGSSRTMKVDVRIVTATHRDLAKMVAAGEFRPDLFYRLNVVAIELPPLRDRREDIPELTRAFIARLSRDLKKPMEDAGDEVLAKLVGHDWPGNIRELQNVLERAVILADGPRLALSDIVIGPT